MLAVIQDVAFGLVGSGLLALFGWNLRVTLDLREKVHAILKHCEKCPSRDGAYEQ